MRKIRHSITVIIIVAILLLIKSNYSTIIDKIQPGGPANRNPSKEVIIDEMPIQTTVSVDNKLEPNETVDTYPEQFKLEDVPEWDGKNPSVVINKNVPYFTSVPENVYPIETYGMDKMDRCTTAFAVLNPTLMPTEERGNIGSVKPTGWHTVKYDGIDGNYLYNRCHLIAFCLTGENANEQNLVTGTRYLNVKGMLPYETATAKFVETHPDMHVMYRVTPVFVEDELVCRGILMEAYSIEDNGAGLQFCIYCYNVQPGVTIDYATGESTGPEFTGSGK